jgi:ubiquitin C-terminal hydrolase
VTKRLFWLLILAGVPSINAQTYWPPSLANCGSTCFINANLQLLYNIRPLTNHLTSGPNPFDGTNAPTPYNYTELINKFENTKNPNAAVKFSCDPGVGLTELNLACYRLIGQPEGLQQDASELMRAFLGDLIENSTPNPDLNENLKSIYQFKTTSIRTCPTIPQAAGFTRKSIEDEVMLNVEIEDDQQRPLNSLKECLENYIKIERLTGENEYFDERIGRKRADCTKQEMLATTPKILIISLKRFRFEYIRGVPQSTKLNHAVIIPTTLDMNNYVRNSNGGNYDLIGVVIQSGTLTGGHYWVYVKNGDQWYYCNDETVTKASIVDQQVIKQINGGQAGATGYILCYQKQLTEAEKRKRAAEEQRRAEERARKQKEEKARRKAEEERTAREKQRAMAEQKRKIEEALKAKQEAARKAEEQRKAAELKKLSDQLNLLTRQLEGLNQSLSKID